MKVAVTGSGDGPKSFSPHLHCTGNKGSYMVPFWLLWGAVWSPHPSGYFSSLLFHATPRHIEQQPHPGSLQAMKRRCFNLAEALNEIKSLHKIYLFKEHFPKGIKEWKKVLRFYRNSKRLVYLRRNEKRVSKYFFFLKKSWLLETLEHFHNFWVLSHYIISS